MPISSPLARASVAMRPTLARNPHHRRTGRRNRRAARNVIGPLLRCPRRPRQPPMPRPTRRRHRRTWCPTRFPIADADRFAPISRIPTIELGADLAGPSAGPAATTDQLLDTDADPPPPATGHDRYRVKGCNGSRRLYEDCDGRASHLSASRPRGHKAVSVVPCDRRQVRYRRTSSEHIRVGQRVRSTDRLRVAGETTGDGELRSAHLEWHP